MDLQFVLKNVYGKVRYYPQCEVSKQLLEFANCFVRPARKAFLRPELDKLEAMGFSIKILSA
jgi:hypothetical protein